ncbi:unnamed protein product [Prunus brigantina]
MNLRFGMMTPTVLDMAALFGLSPLGMEVNAALVAPEDEGSFKAAWPTFAHLADYLAQGGRLALGPFLLGHIYRTLHDVVTDGMKPKHGGPLWAFQFLLQAYFLELRGAVNIADTEPMANALAQAPRKHNASTFCYKFFYELTERTGSPFRVGLARSYPLYLAGAEVYLPYFVARQFGLIQTAPLPPLSLNRLSSWRADDDKLKHAKLHVMPSTKSLSHTQPRYKPKSFSATALESSSKGAEAELPPSSCKLATLFESWDVGTILAEPEARKFLVQMVKGINAQVIEATSVIAAGDLELPFGDEEDDYETLAEVSVEVTPSTRKSKRKEVTQAQDSAVQPDPQAKRLRKRVVNEPEEREEPAAVPTETTETNEELREAFEAVEQEKGQEEEEEREVPLNKKDTNCDEEEEIPAEVIAESIALAKQQEEAQRAELTSLELALLGEVEAEHSAAAPAPDIEVAEVNTAGVLAVVTSPLKPLIVAISMPIHSIPSSPATASFADPELAEFEAMDLDAQLDRLEQLSSNPSKAKSGAVDEAVDRVRIWQSTELDLDEGGETID